MPTQIDTPNGVASSDWAPYGPLATSVVQAVQTSDGDYSVVYRNSGGALRPILYTFPPLVGFTSPVTAASLTCLARWYNGPWWSGDAFNLIWNSVAGSTNYDDTLKANRPNYTSITEAMAGAQLLLPACNGNHGFQIRGSSASAGQLEYWVTYFYRTVTLTYPAGGAGGEFTYLIGSLAGALIGSGLMLREMPALSAFMRRRYRKWLRPEEYEPAWRSWTEQKRMVMMCP